MKINYFKLSSINNRIILASIIVVSAFMLMIGISLGKTFYQSAYSALQERLTGQIYLLMADREITPASINNPYSQVRLPHNNVSSQLSGFISLIDGTVLWQSNNNDSDAMPPMDIFLKEKLQHGKKIFQRFEIKGQKFIGLSITIYWDVEQSELPLVYHISDDLAGLNRTISDYQYKLWSSLIIMSLFLFAALFFTLRWGLKPLREVEQEIKAVEQGTQKQLVQAYPDEIVPLTRNINQLIQFEHQQQQRYRNALADLAHSLKTPLAIIRGQKFKANFSAQEAQHYQSTLNNAVERMNSIIEYQLQRAVSANPSSHIQKLLLEPVINSLIESMKKIYRDKNIRFTLRLEDDIQLRMDAGDFMEIMGNLLDNACKWCQKQVYIKLFTQHNTLSIEVSDDGPGIAQSLLSEICKRGVRADQLTPGHGVGLAIVQDIVNTYNGKIDFTSNCLNSSSLNSSNDTGGGLEIKIEFKIK